MPIRASVIIPTFKRTDWLVECLEGLQRQTLPADEFEVIVVDDGTPGGATKEERVCSGSWKFPLTYLTQLRKGPAAARNLGLQRAAGDLVAFTDDDAVPLEGW